MALFAVVGVCLPFLVVRPDRWFVERVIFEGQTQAGEAELRHLAGLRNGVTVWEVDPAQVAENLRRHPWVADAEVAIRWPDAVLVHVREHQSQALLNWEGDLYHVNEEGEPFLRADAARLDYPLITGLSTELEQVHPRLPRLVIRDALWLLRALDERALLHRHEVSEIRFHRSRGFAIQATGATAVAASGRLLIGFGDYERQLRHLSGLLESGVSLRAPVQVDVAPERVALVRPLPAPSTLWAAASPPSPVAAVPSPEGSALPESLPQPQAASHAALSP